MGSLPEAQKVTAYKKTLVNSDHETIYKEHWEAGEAAAEKNSAHLSLESYQDIKKGRNVPSLEQVSRLSPHLHFGEISPRTIWHKVLKSNATGVDQEAFLIELIWRDYSSYLLYHFPELHKTNSNKKFDRFPWKKPIKFINAWKSGNTGYPIIDAGMRQLAQTGYMHNRVRMIVASFLIKNLLTHWHVGRDWFWEHLMLILEITALAGNGLLEQELTLLLTLESSTQQLNRKNTILKENTLNSLCLNSLNFLKIYLRTMEHVTYRTRSMRCHPWENISISYC